MAKVSVIVPSYNLGQFLPETLDSLLAQSFGDWECIIVENGSVDDSVAIATSYAQKDSRFRVIALPENEGVSVARNKGLDAAAGEYVLFLDADDLMTPDYMRQAVEALDADPSLNVVYGKAERFGTQTHWDLPPFSMSTMLCSNCLYISCFFRRKDAPRFSEEFKTGYEDWDFWLSLLERFQKPQVLQLPSLCFRYRTRRSSRNRGVTDEALQDIRYKLWERHAGLYAKYFPNPLETVEYRRLKRAWDKASKLPLLRLKNLLKKWLKKY